MGRGGASRGGCPRGFVLSSRFSRLRGVRGVCFLFFLVLWVWEVFWGPFLGVGRRGVVRVVMCLGCVGCLRFLYGVEVMGGGVWGGCFHFGCWAFVWVSGFRL